MSLLKVRRSNMVFGASALLITLRLRAVETLTVASMRGGCCKPAPLHCHLLALRRLRHVDIHPDGVISTVYSDGNNS